MADSRLDGRTVTLEVQGETVASILGVVARRMGVDVTQQGTLYYLGQLRAEDRGLLVRRVRRLTSDEVSQAIENLMSEVGRVLTVADGLVVVGDRVEVLQRIEALIEQIDRTEVVTWVVQLYVAELTRSPCQIMIDAGVRQPADVQDLLDLGVAEVIVATETLPDIKIAEQLLRQFGPEHLVLSVDLRHGKVMSPCADWSNRSAVEVANELIAEGFENMILLDVASVGMERGLTVNKSVETILAAHPTIRLTTGGGIRNVADFEAIRTTGLHSVLVATALHDGSISGDAAREWAARS